MDIKGKFLETIKKYDMVKKDEKVLVGVSGGPDSICLLHLFYCLRHELEISLAVAHLDHMFRGKESEEDALFVKEVCDKWNIPLYGKRVNVPKYIDKTGLSPEDAARQIRYAFYNEVRDKIGAQKVALGHNRNDHEETVLMNILRGSGIEGLVGIEPVRDFFIRPLIRIPREDIEAYLKKHKISYRVDKTNLEPNYFRNKIRLELIPMIKQNYCSNLGNSIRRLSEIARCDLDFLANQTQLAWDKVAVIESNKVLIDVKGFMKLHEALKRRIIRKAVECLKGNIKDFEYRHTELVLEFIQESDTGSLIDLPKGLYGEKSYKYFILSTQSPQPAEFRYTMSIPGMLYIKEANIYVKTWVTDRNRQPIIKNNPLIAQFDYDKIRDKLIFRSRQEGDRFIPLGSNFFKKLHDFFIDEKIPRQKRDKIPIVENNGDIIWIIGLRIDDRYKITNNTKKILYIKVLEQEDEI